MRRVQPDCDTAVRVPTVFAICMSLKVASSFNDDIAKFHHTQGATNARRNRRGIASHAIATIILTVLAYDLGGGGHPPSIHVFRGDIPTGRILVKMTSNPC